MGVKLPKPPKVVVAPVEVKQVAISTYMSDNVPSYYVNFVDVSQNQFEAALTCVQIPAKFSPSQLSDVQNSGQLEVEATVQLVIPKLVIPMLIEALKLQEEINGQHFQ